MFKKIDDVSIDKADPFKNDILKREPYAIALTNLIKTISQPIVLSINGPWGDWQVNLSQNVGSQIKK